MGMSIDREAFTPNDYQLFHRRLQEQLDALKSWLAQPQLSRGPVSLGAELEMYLVDFERQPKPCNVELIEQFGHPQLTEELNRFNLEYNLSPVPAAGTPFLRMEQEVRPFLDALQAKASTLGAQIVPIGILPTLSEAHLERDYMTDVARYRLLSKQLHQIRGESFKVSINGEEPLACESSDVTLEGANTSFQVHLRTPADRFGDWFNAAQLTCPLVLALAGNSPTLLGHRLWQETRIALFKQSIDARHRGRRWREPARVTFGNGWLREGAWEIFAENVALHQPLFPLLAPDRPLDDFHELRLHHGTVWPWNRAVLAPGADPHLRIEFRALPAGPTVIDMMANAALAIGWAVALADEMEALLPRLPFTLAEYNFYRAAEHGLAARIIWPDAATGRPTEQPVTDVIRQMLPRASEGLAALGIASAEADRLMAVIDARLSCGQTGSRWQLETLDRLCRQHDKPQALSRMLQAYIDNMMEGNPVAQWQ